MQNSTPDVIEQVPAGGPVNEPASGTYGEKAELARLQQELPSSDPTQTAQQVQPTPSRGGLSTGGGPGSAPAGLPAGLTAPTTRPDVPVSTPLAGPPPDLMAGAADQRQRRIVFARLLSEQGQSPEIREWGRILYQKLTAND